LFVLQSDATLNYFPPPSLSHSSEVKKEKKKKEKAGSKLRRLPGGIQASRDADCSILENIDGFVYD